MDDKRKEKTWCLVLGCALMAAVYLLICSMCSPLYPLNIWDDSNCLLTVGRVMKRGGILYRDIYEQKGPLLYFIHMLAAVVSDSSFFGVFLFEIAALTAVLVFTKKTMRLWVSKESAWAGTAIFGACVLISRSFARGDSAEEFCLPFLMAALYVVCAHAKRCEGTLSAKKMLVLGVLAGCTAVIKYTALGLFVGLCLAQGICLLVRRDVRGTLKSAVAFLAGMALPVLPWLLYFAAHGALYDAYTAYIHNNIFLYHAAPRTLTDMIKTIVSTGLHNISWSLLAVAGTVLVSIRKRESVYLRLAVMLGALCAGAAVFLPGTVYPYYPLVLCVFAPFCLAALLAKVERLMSREVLPVVVCVFVATLMPLSPNAFLRGVNLDDTAQGRLAAQMEPGATLLQYSHLDDGLYLTSGALPQEKYFVHLNVDLSEMEEALDSAVREGRPDYVLVSWRELPAEFDRYELIAYDTGYNDDGRLNKDLFLYKRMDK
ncbi:MAG: hypothetical protein IKB82_02035 [Clostridia bacterium]|nr:hypothetical protein [Clostridia bacterium]